MKKRALIIGGLGQDGVEMSLYLEKKNYQIFSLIKKKNLNFDKFKSKNIKFIICKIQNTKKIISIIKKNKPTEIYNFSGVTTIKESEENILLNEVVNNKSFLALLIALNKEKYKGKIFQSLSAELFGDYNCKVINKKSNFYPINPYAIAKLSSYYYCRYFRNKFKLKIYCGFLFNHDSKYNKGSHLIYYIVNNFQKIVSNKINTFNVKNIATERDWNLATDVIKKIWSETQKKKPSDFILRSGIFNSVEDVIVSVAKFFKLTLIKKSINGEVIFINSQSNKIIIRSKEKKEKFFSNEIILKDLKLIKKNKLLRIIKNILS
jgi:GDPmannose 4,6-dehydratase